MLMLKEMDLGIEVLVAGFAAAVLLTIAAVGPNSSAAPASARPAAQFRTQMDFSLTSANPARISATPPAFGLSKQV